MKITLKKSGNDMNFVQNEWYKEIWKENVKNRFREHFIKYSLVVLYIYILQIDCFNAFFIYAWDM